MLSSLRDAAALGSLTLAYVEGHPVDQWRVEALIRELGVEIDIIFLAAPSTLEVALNILLRPNRPLQESASYSRSSRRKLINRFSSGDIDTVVVDMVRCAALASGLRAKRRVLEMDDVLSKRYRKQAQHLEAHDISPLGSIAKNFPSFVQRLAIRFSRHILLSEAKRMSAAESEVIGDFDCVTLVSPKEAEDLRRATNATKILAVPPAIPFPDLDVGPDRKRSGERVQLIFVGSLAIPHNLDAIRRLGSNIIPWLRAEDKWQIDIWSVGKNDSLGDVERRELESLGVVMLGFVSDISEIYRQADLAIIPYGFGSGVKIKVVEAFAHGLPVVTTSLGVDGLSDDISSKIYNSDSDREMASMALSILKSEDRGFSYAREVRNRLIMEHSHAARSDKYRRILLDETY